MSHLNSIPQAAGPTGSAACSFATALETKTTMAATKNPLSRLAAAIHSELNTEHDHESLVEMPQIYWQRCADLVRQVRRARLRGWHLAANQLLKDLSYAIPSIQHELSTIAECVPRRAAAVPRATMHDIYQDLVALN